MRRAKVLIIITVLLLSFFSVLTPPAVRSDGTNDPIYFNQNTESETDSAFYTISSTVNSFTRGWTANQADGQEATKYGVTIFNNTEPSEYENASFFIEGQDSSGMTEWIPSSSGPMTVAFYVAYMVSSWDNIDPLNLPKFEIVDTQNLQVLTSENVTPQANQWFTTVIYTTIDAGRSFSALWSFDWTNMPPLTPNIYIDSWRVVTFDSEETFSQAPTDQYRMAKFGPNTAGFYGGRSGTLSGQTVSVQICDIMGTGVPGLSLWYDGTKTLVTRIPMNTSHVQDGYFTTYQPGPGESVWGSYSISAPDGTTASGYRLVLASKDIIYSAGYMLQIGPFGWGEDPWHEAWTFGFIEQVDTNSVVASWIDKFSTSNWGGWPDNGGLAFESGEVPMSELTTPSMGVYRKDISITSFGVSGSRFYLRWWGPAAGFSGWIPTSWASLCSVSFVESGLPPGHSWSVTFNDVTRSTSGTIITFNEATGSYPFQIETTPDDLNSNGIFLSPIREGDVGTINVEGYTAVQIEWLPSNQCCDLTIHEVGLPADATWSATFGCISESQSSANDIEFRFSKGTYHFSASSSGYATEPQSFDVIVDPAVTLGPCAGVIFFQDSSPSNFLNWDPEKDSYGGANMGTQWQTGGNCYGFSSTALIYYMRYKLGYNNYPYFPLQDPQATSTSDLKMGSDPYSTLNNPTLAIMFHENYDPQDNVPVGGLVCVDESQQFSFLQQNLSQGLPVVLNIWDYSQHLHSVVAWGYVELENGNYAMTIYDPDYPQSTQAATYNPTTGDFLYSAGYLYTNFIVVSPGMITTSWNVNGLPGQDYWSWWQHSKFFFGVTNYFIVMTNKPVTIDSNGLKDYFSVWSDSRSFVQGISDSSGIEEGDVQVYAVPNSACPFSIDDPGSNTSTIQITHANNESGQPEVYTWLLNASTTDGSLNFTATPTSAGLSIVAGDNPLNATITCYIATQQGYSVSDVLTAQIDAGQSVSLTAPCLASPTASKSVVGKGYAIPVNVTINNAGSNPENVSLTLYANGTALDSEMVYNLMNGTSMNLVCVGNTSSCDYGNYGLSVYCQPNGINEAANNFTGGWIVVAGMGDLTGGTPNALDFVPDGKVDIVDVAVVAKCFGQKVPPAPANCDVSGSTLGVPDGKIDITDVATVAKHFGEHYP